MAGAEGRGAGGRGAPRSGLRGGRRLSAFHCIASRPRISPKILTAVVGKVGAHDPRSCRGSSPERCLALSPGGFIGNGWSHQLLGRSRYALRMLNSRVMGGGGGGEQPLVQGQPHQCRAAAASKSHEQLCLMAEERVVGDSYPRTAPNHPTGCNPPLSLCPFISIPSR